MRRKFWEKRIPTLLGILLITVSVGITTFFVNQGVIYKSNATSPQEPQNLRITNITDNSFTVSYVTNSQTVGSLNFGKNNTLGQNVSDDRDQGTLTNHTVHNITVTSLSPQTKYYFTIISGGQTYTNNGQLFEVTTGPLLSSPDKQQTITGKVLLSNGNPPQEGVVYLTTENSDILSTLTKPDGSYSFSINLLRTKDLSSYYNFDQNTLIKMLAWGETSSSNVVFSFSQTQTIPTIILSKDYDFREGQVPLASISAALENFPTFSTASASGSYKPAILSPKKGQEFTDQQPVFKGTALPNQNVEIIINSDQQIQTSIKSDSTGNWNFRPSAPLDPGTHTITILTKTASGILTTVTQSFVVYAAGQQINPAVPSGTPTPTPTPVQIAVITSTPTPTPTLTPTPTEFIAVTQTASPSASPLPPAGSPFIITAGILGIFIALIGGLLFLLTRGGISSL